MDKNRDFLLQGYSAALLCGAAGLAVWLATTGYTLGSPWIVVALAAMAALAERLTVSLNAHTELSIAPVLTLFSAVLYGPLAAGLVGAVSELGERDLRGQGLLPSQKWLTYTSSRFIAGCAMGAVAMGIRQGVENEAAGIIIGTLVASAVGEVLELAAASGVAKIRGNRMLISTAGPVAGIAVMLYAPFGAGLSLAFEAVSPWAALLFVGPVLAAQRLFALYRDKTHLLEQQLALAGQLSQANRTLEAANLSFAEALVQTLEESDRYTGGHSKAVAIYSRDIARELGLTEAEVDRAYLCGLVHDIGKIGLPTAVLNKEGMLTPDERTQMEMHSEIGERILAKVDAYADVALIVRSHHERLDGAGYPDGVTGEEIPVISRIIAVADAYNAMTSDRPYRQAMNPDVAVRRLMESAGSQFSRSVVMAFTSVLDGADDQYRRARGGSFAPIDHWTTRQVLASAVGSRVEGLASRVA